MSTWRFAGRLAWREVRRRPGRTALVALLVAVPVLAMTFVSVLARNFVEEDPFVAERPAGVDLELSPLEADAVAPVLPDGAEAWTFASVGAPIQDVHGTTTQGVDIHELPDGRPRARILRADGALPGPGEVWLSRNLLDELGVDVGEVLELRYPPGAWRVVGTGDLPYDLRGMFVSELDETAFIEEVQLGTLVDLPGDPPDEEVEATFQTMSAALVAGGTYRGAADISAESDVVLVWTWVAGAVGLGVLGIVIAAAFATSARRQLVTVGLLASNGAP
jgi:putative ABC transport system permease protein